MHNLRSVFGTRKSHRGPETGVSDWRSGHTSVQGFSSVSSPIPPTPKTPYISSKPLPTSPGIAQHIIFPSPSPDSTLSNSSYDSDIPAPQPRYPMPFPPGVPHYSAPRAQTRSSTRGTMGTSQSRGHLEHTSQSIVIPPPPPPSSTVPPGSRGRLTALDTAPEWQRTVPIPNLRPPLEIAGPVSPLTPHPPPPPRPNRAPTPVFNKNPKSILTKKPLTRDVALHRWLIPYKPELFGEDQKLIYWDVSMWPDHVRDYHASVALGHKALSTRYASTLGKDFTRMTIEYRRIKDCFIEVYNEHGITCRDIFKAIYTKFKAKLTDAEKEQFFKETGKRYTSWLEMLNGVTVFMGVMPSRVSHTSWELVLGRDPDEGMNVTPE